MDKIDFLDWASTDLRECKFGVVVIDQDKCTGCKLCEQTCPGTAVEVINKKAKMKVNNECQACGNCQSICPSEAIMVVEGPHWPGYYKLVERGNLSKPRLKW